MKLILAQPATTRFQWELDVLLANIRQFTDMEVVLLFTEKDFTVPIHFRKKPRCSVFVFTDKREDAEYLPSVRPWLLWQYFEQHPEAQDETYFYIDSDVIFREWPDFATFDLSDKTVSGGDCDKYIGHDYIAQCKNGANIVQEMAAICGITPEQMVGVPGIGAHIVFKNFTSEFWKRCYFDSNTIYHMLERADSNIQSWTAEMWAQQWGWVREGYNVVNHSDLDFCKPTDPIAEYDKFKILHNAGVLPKDSNIMFYKGQYTEYSPIGKKFDWVSPDFASKRYAEAVEKVLQ